MSLALKIAVGVVVFLGVAFVGIQLYYAQWVNPRIARELVEDPRGERAQKVMMLTLPSGRAIPVNYLHEGDKVYAGADGRWWKELEGGPHAVRLFMKGEKHEGQARAILDDPGYTKSVFARLRPNAVPGFGTLVEIQLAGGATPAP